MPKVGTDNRELLVTGRGRFIADIAPDDCVDVCFVRSPLPHAVIRSVRLGSSQATWGAELGLQPLSLEAGAMVTVLWHPLPTERVRYVGEPVAMAWGAERYEAIVTAPPGVHRRFNHPYQPDRGLDVGRSNPHLSADRSQSETTVG